MEEVVAAGGVSPTEDAGTADGAGTADWSSTDGVEAVGIGVAAVSILAAVIAGEGMGAGTDAACGAFSWDGRAVMTLGRAGLAAAIGGFLFGAGPAFSGVVFSRETGNTSEGS